MRILLPLLLTLLCACSDRPKPATPAPAPPTPETPEVAKEPSTTTSKDEEQEVDEDTPWPKTHLTTFVINPPKGKDDPMIIQGNKYLEIGRAPKLVWTADESTVTLLEEPKDGAKAASTKKVMMDLDIPWKQNKIILLAPRPFIAKEDMTLTPPNQQTFHKLDPTAQLNHGEEFRELKLKKGQVVDVYMQTISSRCVVRVDDVFSMISCPAPESFTSEHVPVNHSSAPYLPLKEERWYQLEGDDGELGWLRVDSTPMLDTPKRIDRATGLFK